MKSGTYPLFMIYLMLYAFNNTNVGGQGRTKKERMNWIESKKDGNIIQKIVSLLSPLERVERESEKTRPPPGVKARCEEAVRDMLNHPKSSEELVNFLLLSGKGVNDYGSFTECVESPISRYILLSLEGELPIAFQLGICGPRSCDTADYNTLREPLAPRFLDAVNSMAADSDLGGLDILPQNIIFGESLYSTYLFNSPLLK